MMMTDHALLHVTKIAIRVIEASHDRIKSNRFPFFQGFQKNKRGIGDHRYQVADAE